MPAGGAPLVAHSSRIGPHKNWLQAFFNNIKACKLHQSGVGGSSNPGSVGVGMWREFCGCPFTLEKL
jgi:hypothetical protein